MEANEFWLILLSGVAMGLLLSMSVRWIGRRLLIGWSKKKEVVPVIEEDRPKIHPQTNKN